MSTTTMVLILGAIVFSAAGQLLLKSGTQQLADLGRLEFLRAAVRDIRVLSGLAAWIALRASAAERNSDLAPPPDPATITTSSSSTR